MHETTPPDRRPIDPERVKVLFEAFASVEAAVSRSGDPVAAADFGMLVSAVHVGLRLPTGRTAETLLEAAKRYLDSTRPIPDDPEIHK